MTFAPEVVLYLLSVFETFTQCTMVVGRLMFVLMNSLSGISITEVKIASVDTTFLLFNYWQIYFGQFQAVII